MSRTNRRDNTKSEIRKQCQGRTRYARRKAAKTLQGKRRKNSYALYDESAALKEFANDISVALSKVTTW